MERPARIALAGGGTGGHVFPALGIADAIRHRRADTAFLFFGTAGKIEATVVPERGYPFRAIWISGFQRSFRAENILFPLKLAVSCIQAWNALRSFKPDVVVGTGGYVCGPVLIVASWMGIPTVLHESNSYPGITTRMLAARVNLLLTGFRETAQWLPKGLSVEEVGTPVRRFPDTPGREEIRRNFGYSDADVVVLVLGGSQGSGSINVAIDTGLKALEQAGIKLIWQTGMAQEERYNRGHEASSAYRIEGFIEDMGSVYAAADLVVSRAGASTLAELALVGRPAILVPYPYAAEQHQMKNARAVEERGGAIIVPDSEVGRRLVSEVTQLAADGSLRERMAGAMTNLARADAAATIAEKVLSQVRTT